MSLIFSIRQVAVDLLFPRRCPVCGNPVLPKGHLICPPCFLKLSFVKSPTCKRCGKEIDSEIQSYCMDCLRRTRSFDAGMALLHYDSLTRPSMAAIKYQNKREYLDFYAAALTKRFERSIRRINPQLLIPVPVHPSRKRQRGFNQAEVLARLLSTHLDIPTDTNLLFRTRKTLPQKNLTPDLRLKNLEQAFVCRSHCSDLHTVLLVDDIYTTGSTAEACTRALKGSGISRVYVVTVCIGQGM